MPEEYVCCLPVNLQGPSSDSKLACCEESSGDGLRVYPLKELIRPLGDRSNRAKLPILWGLLPNELGRRFL